MFCICFDISFLERNGERASCRDHQGFCEKVYNPLWRLIQNKLLQGEVISKYLGDLTYNHIVCTQ